MGLRRVPFEGVYALHELSGEGHRPGRSARRSRLPGACPPRSRLFHGCVKCSAEVLSHCVCCSGDGLFGRGFRTLRSAKPLCCCEGRRCSLPTSAVATGHEELEEATGEPWVNKPVPAPPPPPPPPPVRPCSCLRG